MPSFQARPAKNHKAFWILVFKVRPVEGSTARHEALGADAMLHHHVCRQTTSLPGSVCQQHARAVLADYCCRCGHGAAQQRAQQSVLRCWQSSSRLPFSPPEPFWKNRVEGLVTTSDCPFRRTRQLRRCSSFIWTALLVFRRTRLSMLSYRFFNRGGATLDHSSLH